MTDKEKLVKEYFTNYPEAKECHVADGYAFPVRSDADNHARSVGQKAETIARDGSKVKVEELEVKRSASPDSTDTGNRGTTTVPKPKAAASKPKAKATK